MKKFFGIPVLIGIMLVLISCQKDRISKLYEKLPELPDDIARTIDTSTMTSKVASVYVAPVLDPDSIAAFGPCCAIRVEREMKVTFPFTKCGPLRDFIVVDFEDLVLSQGKRSGDPSPTDQKGELQYYKFTNSKLTILDQIICVTSNGPWNATLSENRACKGFTPHQTLIISPFGELVTFQWSGGVENHPSNVGLISCRQVSTTRSICPGKSDCDCSSSTCPANDPCDCGISDQW